MPNLARAGSLNGAGATFGTTVSQNLQAWQQPVLPAGANTVTLQSPWPQYPNAVAPSAVPTVTISGGTVTSVTIGGAAVATSGTFPVNNTAAVVIVYTAPPTATWALAPWFQSDPRNHPVAVST